MGCSICVRCQANCYNDGYCPSCGNKVPRVKKSLPVQKSRPRPPKKVQNLLPENKD